MSGIIAVYSLVIAVLIASDMAPPPDLNYSLFKYADTFADQEVFNWQYLSGFMHLACGLSVGLTGLAAGYAIGIVGDMGVRSYMQQSRIFVGMVLILIFGEVLGLYGWEFWFKSVFLASSYWQHQTYCGLDSQHQEQRLDDAVTCWLEAWGDYPC